MNPANFPNINGVMNAGAKPPGQMQGHPKNDNMQYMLASVAHSLQAQGPFSGWRTEVSVRDRTYKVHQMITSLRLIQPQIELRNAAHAAMNFEAKAFREAASKADYDREFNDKLVHIRDTRVRQAQAMQGGMMQQGPATGMPGVGQSPFPQQMNRQMQASPMLGQQQMQMGMNDPTQQASMQQRQQQQQQQQQQPQAMLQQQQRQQPRPGGAAALNDELNSLSPAEYENVCRVATQILQKTSPEDMSKIKVNLQNMSPDQKVYLSKKGMDPITYFFRVQALNQLRRFKRSRMEMARNTQTNGIDPTNAMMGDPMMNQQRQQMFQNMVNMQQRNSPFPMAGQQGIDPSSFIGNVENIQGQQADGLRSQEAGQLVVPASSQMNQQFNAQNMLVGQQMGQVNINNAGISPQFLAQQHLPNGQGNMPDRSQQAAQLQSQPQPQAQTQAQRVQAAQKAQAQMAMSQSGQAAVHMQQQISQSPAMPMLNRPMGAPGQMSPAQAAAQLQPPSRQPGMGQLPPNVQSMGNQPGMQGRPNIPANLPPHVQEQLAQMSTEQLTAFFMNQRRMMANNPALARANPAQQNMALQQNLSQSSQGQQMANGQMGNAQNMRASMGSLGLQQQLAAMAGAQQTNQMMPGQQMSAQQRQQLHQQQQLHRLQLLRQSGGPGMEMSPEQIREMDRVPFPPQIFANNPNAASIPKTIKTWGHLKELANTNPQLLAGTDIQKLMTLQKYHLAQILKETNNRNLEQSGQMPFMPTNFQRQPQPFMNPQQFQPGQQHAQFAMPQIRQITPQDLQVARQRLGAQVQNLTDDQLRDALRQRQMHAAQARAAQALANQQNQQSQPQGQAQVSAPPPASLVKTEPQAPPQMPQQPAQNQVPKPQAAGTPAKTTKALTQKQTSPASKRKVQNEEAVAPQTSPVQGSAQPANSHATAPPRPPLNLSNISREQLAAMTPQQRAQIEAHIRRQQGQTRGAVNRASAEEAWNNIPERIRQQYNELAQNAPPEQPVAVTPEQRTAMNQQLRDCTDYLGRMDALVQFISKIPGHEKNVRILLGMRIQLMRQFKAGPDWTLNEQVTITPEYLTGTTNYIKKLFHHMIARVNQQQNQGSGQRPGAPQAPNAQQSSQNMAPLNASNLQQLQQQEEALQRARRASSQTAASGASAIPPAPFGAPSPHGVPHAYGPGSIPPPELKLPPPKKRKQSHPSTTPVSGPSGPKAQANKQAVVETKPVLGAFKCAIPECQYHYQGFSSQNELDRHVEDNHKTEDPIEDALEFALQSFGTLIKDEEKADAKGFGFTVDLPTMVSNKGTASTLPLKHDVKTEGGTLASGTTPMGRVSSQMVTKPVSPAPSQQLTPSNKAKPTSDGKNEGNKQISMAIVAKDPWADSAISLDAIRDTFLDLTDDSGLGFGPMDEFLNAEMFTGTQDTPDSVETGVTTQTPKDTDISKNDEGGKNGNPLEDSWIPMDWFCLPGRFEDGLLMNESCEDIDWEMINFKGVDENGIAISAM